MKKIFISGSIELKKIPEAVYPLLKRIISDKNQIVLGDAVGIDSLIQDFFKKNNYFEIVVYSIYTKPRYLASNHFVVKTIPVPVNIKDERKRQTFKDEQMVKDSDLALVIWDGASRGSYNNIVKCITCLKETTVSLDGKLVTNKDLNIKYIKDIYFYRHYFSITDYYQQLKIEGVDSIKSAKFIKERLVDLGIISQEGVVLKRQYRDSIRKKLFQGRESFIYKGEMLNKILNIDFKNKVKYTQISLF